MNALAVAQSYTAGSWRKIMTLNNVGLLMVFANAVVMVGTLFSLSTIPKPPQNGWFPSYRFVLSGNESVVQVVH